MSNLFERATGLDKDSAVHLLMLRLRPKKDLDVVLENLLLDMDDQVLLDTIHKLEKTYL